MTQNNTPKTPDKTKEDVVIGSIKRDPLQFFKKDKNIVTGKNIDKDNISTDSTNIHNTVKHNKPKKAFRLAYLSLIAVLIISVGINVYFVINKDKTLINPVSEDRQNAIASLSNNVNTKTLQGDYDGALSEIKNDPNFNGTLEGELFAATVKMNQKDYNSAIDILMKAQETFGPNVSISLMLAQSYQSLEDKTNAIKYYSEYLELLKQSPDYPLKNADISSTERTIEGLQK